MDHDHASAQLAAEPGYVWQGYGEWAPFAPARDFGSRLAGPEHLYASAPDERYTWPRWDPDDPFAALFSLWFGAFDHSEYGAELQDRFLSISTSIDLAAGQPVPAEVTRWVTPIRATADDIDFTGDTRSPGFALIDPTDAHDLAILWNLRAAGHEVFPWPTKSDDRVHAAAALWLQAMAKTGSLDRWRTGDGKPVGSRIEVWIARPTEWPASSLVAFLAHAGVEPFPTDPHPPHGWHGMHPLGTEYTDRVAVSFPEGSKSVEVPIPGPSGLRAANKSSGRGIVAVQVEINSVNGLDPEWTYSVPNRRDMVDVIRQHQIVLQHFHRTTADGRVLGARASQDYVSISAVPNLAVFNHLAKAIGLEGRQTSAGVFSTRLIERLGGPGGTCANQPGLRAGLIEAAGARDGKTSAQIIGAITRYRGAWPGPLASEARRSNYPKLVFHYLLNRRLLRPVLPVTCPHCTTTTTMRPEDLSTDMRCEMCLAEFPLGYALGQHARNDWSYQLAGHVGADRLNETLPMMAALHLLVTHRFRSDSTVPYILGWKLNGPGVDCEIDVAVALEDRGIPIVVIGEAKNYRDSIENNDIMNLLRVQKQLRDVGVECFILIAVMRDLRTSEIQALQDAFIYTPETLSTGSQLLPVLPIILTSSNLSAPEHDEHHPGLWSPADGIPGIAQELCKRNLGLNTVEIEHDGHSWRYKATWSTADTRAASTATPTQDTTARDQPTSGNT